MHIKKYLADIIFILLAVIALYSFSYLPRDGIVTNIIYEAF